MLCKIVISFYNFDNFEKICEGKVTATFISELKSYGKKWLPFYKTVDLDTNRKVLFYQICANCCCKLRELLLGPTTVPHCLPKSHICVLY